MIWNDIPDSEQYNRTNAQLIFEQEMLEYGKNKYWDEYNRAPDEGIPEQELMDSCIRDLVDSYQEWIDKVCESPKCPQWIYPLMELGAKKMADITIRAVIKAWFSSSYWGYKWESQQVIPPLAQTIANQISQDACSILAFQRAKENNRDEWRKQSKFIKNWTPKRCSAFAKKLNNNVKLSVKQKHDFGHNMLRIAATSNIIILSNHKVKRGKTHKNYLSVEFHPTILKELHNRHDILQNSTLVYRPMISVPEDHTMKDSGGYIHTRLRKPVVQKYKSNFFGESPKRQDYSEPSQLVLDGINGLQKTEWAVNSRVLEVMENLFVNDTGLANLPYYSFENPSQPSEDYPKDGTKEEQAKWCQKKEEAWGKWYKQEQSRGRMLVRIQLAKDLLKWDWFYHVYTMDFRGRAYTTCELLSPQSSDLDRGLIQFAKGEPVSHRGRYWQKVHLANLFDQDKISFDARVQWVDDNWDMILRINEDPYSNKEWVDSSVKKNKSFQRLAAVFDIAREDGLSFIPVQLDGKCNGNQHWSAIMGDTTIAHLTGVTPSDIPQDLYQFIADMTTEFCADNSDRNMWYGMFLEYWNNKIERKVTKRSTMCEPYGITFYGIQRYLKEEGHLDWVDREKRGGAIVELARAIKASLDRSLSGPNAGKQFLKDVVEEASNCNKHVIWTTPSGFKVVHYYNKQQKRRSLASLFNKKELTFYVRTDDVSPREAIQAISPNFIHSIDASHMFLTIYELLRSGVFNLSFVHDSYGCHANYVDLLRDIIRSTFVSIHQTNLLEVFRQEVEQQLGIRLPMAPDRGDLNILDVLDSEYFFA